jgi:hypothetical protein
MDTRNLISILILVIPCLISYSQFSTPFDHNQKTINPDLVIQVGAFRNESYAIVLKGKLSSIIDKPVIKITEDGFFKIRITGFSGEEEMEKFYTTLAFLGMKDFWVLAEHKQEEITHQAVIQPDTTIKPLGENTALQVVGENTPAVSQTAIVMQIDVFRDKSEAMKAQKRITNKLNLPVEIVQEWEYYKVFVTGFQTTEEANKYFTALAQLGYSKISLIENYRKNQKPDSLSRVGR